MIIVTGAAGFIGSCLIRFLNENQYKDLVIVDDFSRPDKSVNLQNKIYSQQVERYNFFSWIKGKESEIQAIVHLGARTDTTEKNPQIFDILNLKYSQQVWRICTEFQIPLIYASSAATYGGGEKGFDDAHELVPELVPLNPYGVSKNQFDKWALEQDAQPLFWAGLKFFNVYGPNENHKGRMASVIFHAFNQIQQTGQLKLFRSHREAYEDGKQLRDFIYVKDVVSVILFLLKQRKASGIFNLGTGKARTFLDLGKAVFSAMELEENINFIDTPEDIRETYQDFTEANIGKIRSVGYDKEFTPLENGIQDYIGAHLLAKNPY
ncbi:MAG: ADP-glyceromanno-heptose 6-epimerase [Bacteroidota bacterium]